MKPFICAFKLHLRGFTENAAERYGDEMDVDGTDVLPGVGEKQLGGKGKGKKGKVVTKKGRRTGPSGTKANTIKANEKRPAQIAEAAKKRQNRRG